LAPRQSSLLWLVGCGLEKNSDKLRHEYLPMPTEPRNGLDVSTLPSLAFGHQNVSWLGNVLYMTIEATMFLLLFVTFFYLKTRSPHWPPSGFIPPSLNFGLTSAAIFAFSLLPAYWTKRQAFRQSRATVRLGLALLAVVALALIVVRFVEFSHLNCRWTDNAYASCIWILLGVHTGHLITECIETLVLLAIACTPRMEGIRYADAGMNSDYWYFVVITAFVLQIVVYGTTRWM
jgi:cytochrome c oxidase subunit III